MNNTVNMTSIFAAHDARRAAAESIIASYSAEEVAEASRVASIYDRCDKTSLKHLEDTVRILTR